MDSPRTCGTDGGNAVREMGSDSTYRSSAKIESDPLPSDDAQRKNNRTGKAKLFTVRLIDGLDFASADIR